MKTFYLTFGQKYAREQHPVWKNLRTMYVHPNGYWEIYAKDEEKAREKAIKALGIYWSGLYEKKPREELYPLGVIGIIN